MTHQPCLLCDYPQTQLVLESINKSWGMRRYFRCNHCQLTFMDPQQRLSLDDEHDRYALHQNRLDDQDYINFLKRLALPVSKVIQSGDIGLDYGCGPVLAMNKIFKELGYTIVSYDPHFVCNKTLLTKKYDFIVCSETAEHFYSPSHEFKQFNQLLNDGGTLGVMTMMLNDEIDFDAWHYRKDPTHVCFYQQATFEWIAQQMSWSLDFPQDNIILMKKKS